MIHTIKGKRILENEYREKNNFQKAQEGKLWEEIEKERAKQRQAINGSNNLGLNKEHVPYLGEKGQSRDIIAEKVSMGSGRTYERAKNV